jgi:hypothetical protein
MLFEKTNLRKTNWTTWTFDPLPDSAEDEAGNGESESLPTVLDFVMVILPEIRRFPEAYQAMLDGIRKHWPFLSRHAPASP